MREARFPASDAHRHAAARFANTTHESSLSGWNQKTAPKCVQGGRAKAPASRDRRRTGRLAPRPPRPRLQRRIIGKAGLTVPRLQGAWFDANLRAKNMSAKFKAYAATAKGQPLTPFEFDPGPLGVEQVEINVSHCGICHSDLSMLDNEWGFSTYPFVAGHEVAGTVVAAGDQVKRVKVGDRVGLGWFSASCLHCPQCLAGDHNLCATVEQTMIGRFGGFADRVRCHWLWATPLPAAIDRSEER